MTTQTAQRRLVYKHESKVVHVRHSPTHTACGLHTPPKDRWRDEGVWDGNEFETMCGRCRRIVRERAARQEAR